MDISIKAMEHYLADRYTGWTTEQSLFMKLVEEMGEVAEVLNKRSGAKARGAEDLDLELGRELADVIHYAVAIAGITGLDLAVIMLEKDAAASRKYGHDTDLTRFLPRWERIRRVERMEAVFDAVQHSPDPEGLRELRAYYESGQWQRDYEADERGELPRDLKRGVLSQDALWDLLA
jgi:NTP pyrophosphatase (non-canonical NTP hydrolase)